MIKSRTSLRAAKSQRNRSTNKIRVYILHTTFHGVGACGEAAQVPAATRLGSGLSSLPRSLPLSRRRNLYPARDCGFPGLKVKGGVEACKQNV